LRICPACGANHRARDWTCPACGRQPERRDGIVYFAPAASQGGRGDATYQHEELWKAEDSHFWFRARAKLLVWAVERHFPRVRSLLDVGCGRGAILFAMRRRFPSAVFAGAELIATPLRLARKRLPDVDLYQMDARQLPFDREFDVVTSCDVLEHLDDDRAVARQLFRALVPGGGLIVTVPQHPWLWSAVDIYSHHRRRYERRQLAGVIEQAGFVVERATSFVTALLPLVLISRRRQNQLTSAFDPTAELKIGRGANKALETALDLERWMIRAGVSLPIGSSLLIVARRPKA
jgi:2-polyprenyl-3-methyl-5-hydroxy-6-metoxy-1,4-benzoquinol methylase